MNGVFHNARTSLNKYLRPKVEARNYTFLPNDWDVTAYPSLRLRYLYHGRWNSQRRRFESRIQFSVFQADKKLADASLFLGGLLKDLGFDSENQQMTAYIPQFNHAENPLEELLEMELEWISGPEPGPVSEPEEIHQMMDFKLYFI